MEVVMEIKRDGYLQKLILFMWDGQVKVITGIRRCGKSYLLNPIFKNYLLDSGVSAENIISFELDKTKDIKYRNPLILTEFLRNAVEGVINSSIYLWTKFKCRTKCRTLITRTESRSLFMMLLMI